MVNHHGHEHDGGGGRKRTHTTLRSATQTCLPYHHTRFTARPRVKSCAPLNRSSRVEHGRSSIGPMERTRRTEAVGAFYAFQRVTAKEGGGALLLCTSPSALRGGFFPPRGGGLEKK
jgi:hypothetical protein